jgi:hypothetical protein
MMTSCQSKARRQTTSIRIIQTKMTNNLQYLHNRYQRYRSHLLFLIIVQWRYTTRWRTISICVIRKHSFGTCQTIIRSWSWIHLIISQLPFMFRKEYKMNNLINLGIITKDRRIWSKKLKFRRDERERRKGILSQRKQ